jgi:ankyrin repeat protein
LDELPETLDETYERILSKIPRKKRNMAHKLLHYLAFSGPGSNFLAFLAEIMVVDIDQNNFSPENRFLNPKADLLEICTCLVTFHEGDGEDSIAFAHYTVKEYLTSQRILLGPAAAFYVSRAAYDFLAARTYLVYLLNIDYEGLPQAKYYYTMQESQRDDLRDEIEAKYPLLQLAILNLPEHTKGIKNGAERAVVNGLIIKLLTPGPHFYGWREQSNISYDMIGAFPMWTFGPGAESAMALAYACFLGYFEVVEMLLEQSPATILENRVGPGPSWNGFDVWCQTAAGTPLHIAACLEKVNFVRLLIEGGANTNALSDSGTPVLNLALPEPINETDNDSTAVVKLLLEKGACPNPFRVSETPLQVAVTNHAHIASIQALLEAGADVNGVGFDEAVVARIKYECSEKPEVMEEIISSRGAEHYYDTPLRIVETSGTLEYWTRERLEKWLSDVKQLLRSHGAKSLHLFPGAISPHTETYMTSKRRQHGPHGSMCLCPA